MTRVLAALVLGLVLYGAADARAQGSPRPTAGDFVDLCVSPNAQARTVCGTVIVGLIDTYSLIGAKRSEHRVICPTRSLEPELARQMFITWYERHPEAQAYDFTEAVVTALRDRYPCTTIQLPRRRRATE